ncbi:MAG: penicillin-binding protein 2, partial [Eubacterium sp.]|nr:penicillin-binding protein 2 [Eubacterium sp.]
PVKTALTYQEVSAYEKFKKEYNRRAKDSDSDETKAKIELARNIRGITFESYYKRVYPYGSLACHLIGFTSSGNVGNWGIEQYYNSTLNGVNGRSYSYFNQELIEEETIKEPVDGNCVVSTIDLQIQQVIEKKLKEYDRVIGSNETSILVMNPKNGEILGMASSDPFDLNDPVNEDYLHYKFSDSQIAAIERYTKKVQEKEARGEKVKANKNKLTKWEALSKIWRNPVISDTHEPGSTYKPFTVCAWLESGVLKGDEDYVCTGSLHVSNRNIGCSHVHGNITLKQAVAQSCNVAMMNIAFKEGADRFYYYQDLFGFGRKTGIDLPGEADTSSLLYNASNYGNSTSLATNAFGQNFNCSMIQMACGFASLINGGYYYQPHVVKEIQNSKGDIVETREKEVLRNTISAATSSRIRSYMKETVESGTGVRAQIDGYEIGGKTGTAEKLPRNKKDYYISFVGFTPVDDPQVLIYVTIDEPHIEHQDNARLAVGLERECMKGILDILDIQPTRKTSSDSGKKEYYLDEFTKKNKKK